MVSLGCLGWCCGFISYLILVVFFGVKFELIWVVVFVTLGFVVFVLILLFVFACDSA